MVGEAAASSANRQRFCWAPTCTVQQVPLVSVVDLESARERRQKANNCLVGVAGFEPATPASRTQCSTGLSHTPTKNAAYSLGFRPPQGAHLRKLIPVNVGLKTQILPAGAATAAAARALADGGLVAF